ncbi:MAG TPA: DUF2283 domain-containing protein [Candidatus Paceibacterota bacterium]
MKIAYDKKVDSLNVTLRIGKVEKTIEVAPEVFLDVDKNGNPLYLEIVGVRAKIGSDFSKITIGKKSVPVSLLAM